MRKRVGAQPDLFQAPVPAIGLPEFLNGKAVELLRRLLMEAITLDRAEREEKDSEESGYDHDHG
jgi:hypothetical protein